LPVGSKKGEGIELGFHYTQWFVKHVTVAVPVGRVNDLVFRLEVNDLFQQQRDILMFLDFNEEA
jgi:hypothetical protein